MFIFQKIIEIKSCAKPLTEEAEKGDKEMVLNQKLPHSPWKFVSVTLEKLRWAFVLSSTVMMGDTQQQLDNVLEKSHNWAIWGFRCSVCVLTH